MPRGPGGVRGAAAPFETYALLRRAGSGWALGWDALGEAGRLGLGGPGLGAPSGRLGGLAWGVPGWGPAADATAPPPAKSVCGALTPELLDSLAPGRAGAWAPQGDLQKMPAREAEVTAQINLSEAPGRKVQGSQVEFVKCKNTL